jgi:hypothetical protein
VSRSAAKETRRNGTIRCAIYTRKSSEEGLEQEFNSLQAQPEGYDDGGLSGATMERREAPASIGASCPPPAAPAAHSSSPAVRNSPAGIPF